MKWEIIEDRRTNTLAVAHEWNGSYLIRWAPSDLSDKVSHTFYLYHQSAGQTVAQYLDARRSIKRLLEIANRHLQTGSIE